MKPPPGGMGDGFGFGVLVGWNRGNQLSFALSITVVTTSELVNQSTRR